MRAWIVVANAVCTGTAGLGFVPALVVYPVEAQRIAARSPAGTVPGIALDAGLCFGPLLLPALIGLGAFALSSAYARDPRAPTLNARATAAWFVAGALVAIVFTPR